MPARSFWKGYLKLSLVTCPVSMMPATTDSGKIRFHTLNRKTGHRIESRYIDAITEQPVEADDQVKGYERGDDDYVVIEDEDLEAVSLASTRTIDIDMFVDNTTIGWVWYDQPHYLTPSDPVGEEAFAVIRDAMASTKTVGLSRLVLYRRERAVMLEPRDKGIVLWTLRYGDEVRDPKDFFTDAAESESDPKAKELIRKVIEERTLPWDPGLLADPVQERLHDIIEAKKKGRKPPKSQPHAAPPASNVVDIMDALRRSLAGEAKAKTKK